MKNRLILWLILVLLTITVFQPFAEQDQGNLGEGDLGVMTNKTEYGIGKEIILEVRNNTAETVTVTEDCSTVPFEVLQYNNGDWIDVSTEYEADCESGAAISLDSGETHRISYQNWSYRVFGETGRYRIDVDYEEGDDTRTFSSNEFTIKERGAFGSFWLNGIYRPILNTLVFLIKTVPGYSLGWAIILLTLILRTILLVPSQRAIRSQRKLQEVQPKLEAIKQKYKDNQEKIAMETMKIWQTHKVNPFGSCMMMLIQFPILIALYYVVREGLHPDKIELLYSFVATDFSFDLMETNFLGVLELMKLNIWVLPLIVGGLQFIQMSLAMARAEKKRKDKASKKPAKKKKKKKPETPSFQSEMQNATKMMKYVMPVMIAFFTASLPAGVGLYWGTSTIYGIVQQIVVNRESAKAAHENEPVVRVIEN